MLWTARYTPPARHITLEEGEVEYTTCARQHTMVLAALEDMESHNAQIVLKTVKPQPGFLAVTVLCMAVTVLRVAENRLHLP